MTDKDLRIIKLHEKGMDTKQIARKIGYGGGSMQKGIERVEDTLRRQAEASQGRLLSRKVYGTPVTIKPGEDFNIKVNVKV